MKDYYFHDRDGNPLTGKVPVALHVFGDGDQQAAVAEASIELQTFLMDVQLSSAPYHRRDVRLLNGQAQFQANHGEIRVDVFAEPAGQPSPTFYGGILLKINVVEDEEAYMANARHGLMTVPNTGDLWPQINDSSELDDTVAKMERYGRHELKLVPSCVKFSGEDDEHPGRPAVPGTPDGALTEWLIIQIARDRDLTDEPIRNGAIKIYRIHEPKFGDIIELKYYDDEYLLSTKLVNVEEVGDTAPEFYMCGQVVQSIPPMNFAVNESGLGTDDTYSPKNAGSALRTFNFAPVSFETAGESAKGIVIFAIADQLWACNSAAETPEWSLLDTGTRPSRNPNQYGRDFTESISPSGVATITCSGTNGAGDCSGFVVTITPQENAPAVITGKITLAPTGDTSWAFPVVDEWRANGANTIGQTQIEYTYTNTYKFWVWPGQYETDPPEMITQTYDEIHTYPSDGTDSSTITHVIYSDSGSETVDRFLGGVERYQALVNSTKGRTVRTTKQNSTLTPVPSPDPPVGYTSSTWSPELTWETEYSVQGYSGVGTFSYYLFTGMEEPTVSVTSYLSGGAFDEPSVHKHIYTARDTHTRQLALRIDQGRSGSTGYTDMVTGNIGAAVGTVQAYLHYNFNAWRLDHKLLRPDGSVVIAWNNVPAMFPPAVEAAASAIHWQEFVSYNIPGTTI